METGVPLGPLSLFGLLFGPVLSTFALDLKLFGGHSPLPFIFLTARVDDDEKISGLKGGAVDYIYKQFNLEMLKLKIDNLTF